MPRSTGRAGTAIAWQAMCDTLVSLGPDGALFAKNSDRPPTEAQAVEWHPPARLDGAVQATWITVPVAATAESIGFVASRPTWAWGVEHGVNEAGVAIGNEAIFTTLDPCGAPPGLPGFDLVRLGLMLASSAADAAALICDLVAQHGQGGSGQQDKDEPYWSSFLIADAGAAFVVDTNGRESAVQPVEQARAISNKTSVEEWRHPHQPVETMVDPRLHASEAVLAAPGGVTVESLKAHLRSHVGPDGWTVCMHVEDVEATTAAMVASLGGVRPVARMLLGSPCRSLFVPLVVGQPFPAWDTPLPYDAEVEARLEHTCDPAGPDWNARTLTTLLG